ncbi:collagen alpha-6(VI) chain-like [Brienomyrus brachyistius]|uniref:collagen alpha-6(VI) chain-like n=1 Tax=Brienomyrus brachyistius TaxID=42636 RepID=UPI0020B26773|nr:collagen alpha-6(VI) chain-like [Brienomyrus brachyistius]
MGLITLLCFGCLIWIQPSQAQNKACSGMNMFDLMFFVHYSSEINFQPMKDFLQNFIGLIDPDHDIKMGLAFLPSQRGDFNLTRYTTSNDILSKIRSLRPRPSRRWNMGGNLKKFLTGASRYFSGNVGGRSAQKVPQVAVLLTDNVGTVSLRGSSTDLHVAGVTVYVINIGTRDTKSNLFYVASYPYEKTIITVDTVQDLSQVSQDLLKDGCYRLSHKYRDYWETRKIIQKRCSKNMRADVYFLIDDSSTVTLEQFNEIKRFLNNTVQLFQIRFDGVRAGVVQYAASPATEIHLLDHTNKTDLTCAISYIEQKKLDADIANGLQNVLKYFRSSKRANTPQYLVILREGYQRAVNKVMLETATRELHDFGVVTYAIGEDSNTLEKLASSPDKYFRISDFAFLKDIELQVAHGICESAALRSSEADIIFLHDSSYSESLRDHELMKEFMKAFMESITSEQNGIRAALIEYTDEFQYVFDLEPRLTLDEYKNAIDSVSRAPRGPLADESLTVPRLFDKVPDKDQHILVFITDGKSHTQLAQLASDFRSSGTDVYAIMNSDAEMSNIENITESKAKIFQLHQNVSTLVDRMHEVIQKECQNADVADIVFALDVSWDVQEDDFELMKNFIISVASSFLIGQYSTQVGVILYGANARQGIGLDEYKTFMELESGIRNMNFGQVDRNGRNIAMAIQLASDLLSRKGREHFSVPRFIITVTHKDTTDLVQLKTICTRVQDSGVHTLAVGIDYADTETLKIIGESDSSYFSVKSFDKLKYLSRQVIQEICSAPYCNIALVDVAFLIDGSESITPDQFDLEKDFVKSIVNSFDIHDHVRVGLATFSETCDIQFNMKAFNTRLEFAQEVDAAKPKYKGTNLAVALNGSRQFFIPSRRRKDVKPRLIVMTDGDDRNQDKERISQIANLLRNVDDVTIVVVVVGEFVNPVVLNLIAGERSNIYRTVSHSNLKDIAPRIVRAICDDPECIKPVPPPTVPPPPNDCLIDIAVGIDVAGESGDLLLFYHHQLRLNLLPTLTALNNLLPSTCTKPLSVRFGFHVPNTDPPFVTTFQPLSDDIVKQLEMRVIRETSRLDARYLLSFGEKFRRESDRNTYIQVILLFTDGLDASYAELNTAIESLRRDGVQGLITVALDGMSKEAIQELHAIEFGPFGTGFCCRAQLVISEMIAGALHSAFVTFAEEVCCSCCVCVGPPGPRGLPGVEGVEGSKGQKGMEGHTGDDGMPGAVGKRGVDGPPGDQGCAGHRGVKGSRGFTGDKGENGVDGWNGIQGQQGDPGLDGHKGAKGDRGSQGNEGPPGPPGDEGEKGLPGEPGTPGSNNNVPGPKGDLGRAGYDGDSGPDGSPGQRGEPGNKGKSGQRGPEGILGTQGEKGAEGLQGEPGFRGEQGLTGVPGAKGEPGDMGWKGPQGAGGLQGNKGSKGNRGRAGQKGQPGLPGEKGNIGNMGFRGEPGTDGLGVPGTPGPKGRKGTSGSDGHVGLWGEVGEKGSPGDMGPKGHQGTMGLSGQKGVKGDPGEPGYPGRRGPKGGPGTPERTECSLLDFVRDNCACQGIQHFNVPASRFDPRLPIFPGCHMCPSQPLDLVIAYDMSSEVLEFQLNNMKSLITRIIEDMKISESNCPAGVRLAIMSYSDTAKQVIRFSDYLTKGTLLRLVNERVLYERTSRQRDLGEAMTYTAKHMFKRTRGGSLVTKMAIFMTRMYMGRGDFARILTTEQQLYTAAMELYANDITPVIVTSVSPETELTDAFLNFPGRYGIISDSSEEQIMGRLRACFLCYDSCHADPTCPAERHSPVNVDADVLFMLDSSDSISEVEYQQARGFLYNMVDQFGPSGASPSPLLTGARFALVQHSGVVPRRKNPIEVEFDFHKFAGKLEAMKNHIHHLTRRIHGSSALGLALDYVIERLFDKQTTTTTSNKVIFIILGGAGDHRDPRLKEIALKVKCAGYIIFTLSLGSKTRYRELYTMSSMPISAHSCQLDAAGDDDISYALRFAMSFFSFLPKRPSTDPHWRVEDCDFTTTDDVSGFDVLSDGAHMEAEDIPKQAINAELDFVQPEPDKQLPAMLHVQQPDSPSQLDTRPQDVAKMANGLPGELAEVREGPREVKPQMAASELSPTSKLSPVVRQSSELVGRQGQTLPRTSARCLQNKDNGRTCRRSQAIQWFYNRHVKRCAVFWYSGCDGNGNRFPTQAACRQLCVAQRSHV